jgi:hypothetical protein
MSSARMIAVRADTSGVLRKIQLLLGSMQWQIVMTVVGVFLPWTESMELLTSFE